MDIGIETFLFYAIIGLAFLILVIGILKDSSPELYKAGLFLYFVSGIPCLISSQMDWIIAAKISGAILILVSLVVIIASLGNVGNAGSGFDLD